MSLTFGDIQSLPLMLDAHATADLLGCSYSQLLATVREGSCPVEPLRLGRAFRFPTVKVLEVVGIDWRPEREGDAATNGVSSNNLTSPWPLTNEGQADGTT